MDSKLGGSSHPSDPETRSTISSSDLLPAYSPRMVESSAMQVAKLISRTLLLITLIISLLVLLTVYIQAKGSMQRCSYGLNARGAQFEPLTSESAEYPSGGRGGGGKIPISIRMSGRAGDLMNAAGGPNGKGHVNCVIERKTANQIIASEPKKLFTPYGNITTDPRLIHLTGEKLVFSCHSGDKENEPPQREKDIIIITNNKEVIEPPKDTENGLSDLKDSKDSNSKEVLNELVEPKDDSDRVKMISREKRSAPAPAAKEMTCQCAC